MTMPDEPDGAHGADGDVPPRRPVRLGWIIQSVAGVVLAVAVTSLPWATREGGPPPRTTTFRTGPHASELVAAGAAIVVAAMLGRLVGHRQVTSLVLVVLGGLALAGSIVLALGAIHAANSSGSTAGSAVWATTSYGMGGGVAMCAGLAVLLVGVFDHSAAAGARLGATT